MTSESHHGHNCDDVSVPLAHLPLDRFDGTRSACLVAPAFYFTERLTRISLARSVVPYLASTAGKNNFAGLVFEALDHHHHDRSGRLGKLVADVPEIFDCYPEVRKAMIDDIRLGKRDLQDALRRAQPKRVDEKRRDEFDAVELLRLADAMTENGHQVFLGLEGEDDILCPRQPTSDQMRLLQVAGDEESAEALRKATQGKRRPPEFQMAIAIVACDVHRWTAEPVEVLAEAPWSDVLPCDSVEKIGGLHATCVRYVLDPALCFPDGAAQLV